MCFGEKLSCGRVSNALITVFPWRGTLRQRRWIWLSTEIYFHDGSIHHCPLCSDELSSSCLSLPLYSLKMLHMGRFSLFYIISPRGRSMILYHHLVAEWQHYTLLNRAAWIVQQLGMWMYHYLLLPQLFSAVTIVGLAYLCMCTPVSTSNALSVSVFAQVNQGKTIVC